MRIFRSGIVFFLAGLTCIACEAQNLVGLGDLPGGNFQSTAYAISVDGSTIIGESETEGADQPFAWTADTGIFSLGVLPFGTDGIGYGVSEGGVSIVGSIRFPAVNQQAFVWNANDGYLAIGNLGGNGSTEAFGISEDGNVVVGESFNTNGQDEAFYWSVTTGIRGLGNLAGDTSASSSANATSANGQVIVGSSENSAGDCEAFYWTDQTEMVGLGDLPGGSIFSTATDINGNGTVIVGYSRSAIGDFEAFRWTVDQGMVGLGLFPNDQPSINNAQEGIGPFTQARGVSANGEIIVGEGYETVNGRQAFIWNEVSGIRSIESVLAEFGVEISDWRLIEAYDVSADGRKMVGEGRFSGTFLGDELQQAFLVDFNHLDLTWTGDGAGDWDDLQNWKARLFLPGPTDHAILDSTENFTIVNGPTSLTQVRELTVGENSEAQVALRLQNEQQLEVVERVNIGTQGKLTGNGHVSTDEVDNLGEVDLNEFGLTLAASVLENGGLLLGSGRIDAVVLNQFDGEIRIDDGERMLLNGESHFNAGMIQLLGGTLDITQSFNNAPTGRIVGRGAIFADVGIGNVGTIATSGGFTDCFAQVFNSEGGTCITSGGGTTTFYEDVEHNGQEIRTSFNSSTTFFGSVSGDGPFTGTGNVFMEGDLQPGNSPGSVRFEGNLDLSASSSVEIEIGGTNAGTEYDQLVIEGDLFLEGELIVIPINGFRFAPNQRFEILTIVGTRTGIFNSLPEGALIGTFGGVDLFITYNSQDGNDVAIVTSQNCGTLRNGQLIVDGTNANDTIAVTTTDNGVSVVVNGCNEEFGKVESLVVNGLDGDDLITVQFPGVTVFGGNGNDTITAEGAGGSILHGEDGNDTIVGALGRDEIFGGPGDDDIDGRNGNDWIDGGAPPLENPGVNTLRGGAGSDTILGGLDIDFIIGGGGSDTIFGYDGNDLITGGDGGDQISGGGGDDDISGGSGYDTIMGGPGNDDIGGGDGQDLIQGGQGNDTLNGNRSHDVIEGGTGDDTLTGGEGNDFLDGGPGNDTATDMGEAGEINIENGL